jgi:hypothetical protein
MDRERDRSGGRKHHGTARPGSVTEADSCTERLVPWATWRTVTT